jgi:hypothetical protein
METITETTISLREQAYWFTWGFCSLMPLGAWYVFRKVTRAAGRASRGLVE